MSIAAGAFLLPADPEFRAGRERDARYSRLRNGAITAAALLHAAVIAIVIIHWPGLFPVVPNEKPPIPVTLVTVPPPPPPAPRAQPTPPPPAQPHELVSGSDDKTTAPPKAPDEGPVAAPKPLPPPPFDTPANSLVATPKPEPEQEPHPAKPKVAKREVAPERSRVVLDRAPGDAVHDGDPYLNRVNALLDARYHYPANAISSLGLHLEGTVAVLLAVLPDGSLGGVQLESSSGSPMLDQEAIKEVEEAAPFPPPPAYLVHDGMAVLERDVHYFPGAS